MGRTKDTEPLNIWFMYLDINYNFLVEQEKIVSARISGFIFAVLKNYHSNLINYILW